MDTRARLSLVTAGIAGSAVLVALPASAASPADGPTVSVADADNIAGFWFRSNNKALKAATQWGPDAETVAKVAKLSSKGGPSADGKAGTVSPTGPGGQAGTSKNINIPKTLGKVFFQKNGKTYWCSATSIQAKYKNLVATAGHCVFDTDDNDHMLNRWIFVPGYYQGKAPFGVYVAKQGFTHYDFDVYEDYDRDYAFVTVYNGVKFEATKSVSEKTYKGHGGERWRDKGKWWILTVKDAGRLGDNVGGQGLAYNQKVGAGAVYAFGYPAARHPDGNKAFTGVTPKWCYGKPNREVTDASLKIEEQIAITCSMTPGADGGPWLLKYSNARRLGYVNGVTSAFADSNGNDRIDKITSPYFDGETYDVYKAAANNWSGSIVKK
ncbi:trypsin-like serine peptidase [Herbidospora cretacea]|uniref:trypsin-like serine peptidase n=1 Tax=Herbidospora cretacea TaxID=28444 RepID=UPI000B028C0F|nr:hypothetical protein [Herbidospora cretacea]